VIRKKDLGIFPGSFFVGPEVPARDRVSDVVEAVLADVFDLPAFERPVVAHEGHVAGVGAEAPGRLGDLGGNG